MKAKRVVIIILGVTVAAFMASGFIRAKKEIPVIIKPGRPAFCASTTSKDVIRNFDTTRQIAPLLNGLGDYKMEVTSVSKKAKQFFQQGLTLYYGFNHLEAFRSFKEASRIDPQFAMAYWGQAMSLGPNINVAMDPADGAVVYEAVEKAVSLVKNISNKEQMLILAVSKRYAKEAPADRTHLDEAYADQMKKVLSNFPNDPDVVTLYAEALMDLHPWDYWLKDGTGQSWTPEIVNVIEHALKLSPHHPGANHFYIHAYEAASTPGKATESADILGKLAPSAGHLVHMPSHIYIRTGRYKDGVIANKKAIKSDEEYIAQCKATGFYPLILYPHNIHFLWACATLDGQSAEAIKAADRLAAKQNFDLMIKSEWSSLQHFYATPYYARVRFGKWDDILRLEKPDNRFKYANAIYRYARAIAFSRKKQQHMAAAELGELKKIASDTSLVAEKILGVNSTVHVLRIAVLVTEGELAAAEKNYELAVTKLKEAVISEDQLLYQEPYDWHHPARQILGDILLEAGDAEQAERYFREDLQLFANNGWSMTGLKCALEKQGKLNEAAEVSKKLKSCFARADIKLKGGRF